MVLGFSVRRKVWLSLAALAVSTLVPAALASPGAGDQNPLRSLQNDLRAPWTVADFNGDHRLDLVTASSSRNYSGGYTYRLEIGLGGPESGWFSFASSAAKIRLTARDVDGDHDADLVVLGAISATPIDLWLNDGAGHFRHGDVSQLPAENQTASLEGSAPHDDTPATISDDQHSPAALRPVLLTERVVVGRAAATVNTTILPPHRANLRCRAPPR